MTKVSSRFELQRLLDEEKTRIKKLRKDLKLNQNNMKQIMGKMEEIKEANEIENMGNRNILINVNNKFDSLNQTILHEASISKAEREQLNRNLNHLQASISETVKNANEMPEEKLGMIMQENEKKFVKFGEMSMNTPKSKLQEGKNWLDDMETTLIETIKETRTVPDNGQIIKQLEETIKK
jgi:uncharacterized protein YoxC